MRKELLRVKPTDEGINPQYIINFLDACEREESEIHGFMMERNDHVVAEVYQAPYTKDIPHIMHSFTKILTNTAVALAYSDGLLKLDDPILKFFPEYEEEANEYLKACTIRNLITMRNGQQRSIGGNEWRPLKTSWKEAYFKVPFDKTPGETYMYSSGNSYILSYIVQQLEGKTCHELIRERISPVIGLNEFTWMLSPEGVCSGGNGVSLTAEDMLRIGMLYLNRGKWEGQQLISEEWIDNAMGYCDPIPPVNGLQYNFHWDHFEDIWAGRGMFGQTCAQIPSLNMVFTITAADSRYVAMHLFQKEVIDPMKEDLANGVTLSEEECNALNEKLDARIAAMTLQGPRTSVDKHVELANGNYHYQAEENEDHITDISLEVSDDAILYGVSDHRGHHEVKVGRNAWCEGTTTMTCAYLHHQYEQDITMISAISYWTDEKTLMMEWRFPEMAFFDHVTLTFDGDTVSMKRWVNMNSQATERPVIHAHL